MEILEQLYHLNFQGFKHDIDKYLAITEDTTNNVNDWKLFELFSKLILSNHL